MKHFHWSVSSVNYDRLCLSVKERSQCLTIQAAVATAPSTAAARECSDPVRAPHDLKIRARAVEVKNERHFAYSILQLTEAHTSVEEDEEGEVAKAKATSWHFGTAEPVPCSILGPLERERMVTSFTVACESALRSAGTLLSRVRAPLPAPWPDGGPESLRSPCCGLAIYKNSNSPSSLPSCPISISNNKVIEQN
ncbi:hypothetical protein PoB_007707300 [Plakobranchus ocellatus]|uniref:Uncharacterized protein n=1 Tax=Plakobranchus ocellatus TaxID=259542 RepID=A0AAV4E1X8_9GAST|nr:hypothetical protein PoB_007707300 [Plakobranchus ocellatus]